MLRSMSRVVGSAVLCSALVAVGCGPSRKELRKMSADDTYRMAEELMQEGRPGRAIPLYERVDTRQSNELKAQVHLRLADAYFMRGGILNLAEAQTRYQSFLNFYPLSDQAAYAQYRFALCLKEQINSPERDQAPTFKALEELRKVEGLYPSSPWVAESRLRIEELQDHLSMDALLKARYYHKRGAWPAAIARLKEILETHPSFSAQDEVLYRLGTALKSAGRESEGEAYLEQLRTRFPDSAWRTKPTDVGEVAKKTS
jgi:outer membrane protein assembly factor BamD